MTTQLEDTNDRATDFANKDVIISNISNRLPESSDIESKFSPKLLLAENDIAKSLLKLVAVSGHTREAVNALLDKARERRKDDEFLSLLHAVHKNDIPGHRVRGYEILDVDDTRELSEMDDPVIASLVTGNTESQYQKRPIWFLFSGMCSQWPGMGQALLNVEVCHRSIRRCADMLKPLDVDLMDIITNGTLETFKDVINCIVSIVAVQVSLVDLLTSIGVHPNGLVGVSLGELACSYADGAFTLEQTMLAAYYRGKSLVDSEIEPGAMAAISLSWEETAKFCPPDVFPVCNNSADSVTIAGPIHSVTAFVERMQARDIQAKLVDSCGVAFHSKYIASAGQKLRVSLDKIIPEPKRRSRKWISASIPEDAWDGPLAQFCSSAYHVNNFLSPVLLLEAAQQIPTNAIVIEIAPRGLMQTVLRKSLPPRTIYIDLQKRCHENMAHLLTSLGKMYLTGAQLDLTKLYPPIGSLIK